MLTIVHDDIYKCHFRLAYWPTEMITQTHTILDLFLSPLFVSGMICIQVYRDGKPQPMLSKS